MGPLPSVGWHWAHVIDTISPEHSRDWVGAMPSELSTVSNGQSVEELRRELADAREQQAATARILSAISSSPTDAQRVFAEIAASASQLCVAYDATIFQVDGDVLRNIAKHGPTPQHDMLPLTHEVVAGRAVLERRTVHVANMEAATADYPEGSDLARRFGIRTILAVPLVAMGTTIGVIVMRRTEVRPFTERQIDLLKVFADQTVIAIENTRLFEAEQARTRELSDRTRELTESLEYQTATSDVLNVISHSPSNLQPVFDAIAAKALDLCKAKAAAVYRFDGEFIHLATPHSVNEGAKTSLRDTYPLRPSRAGATGRAILSRSTVYIPDISADPEYELAALAEAGGYASILSVPMLHEGKPIGTINATGTQVAAFSPKQRALL